jgi:hypothetical protein
LEGIASRDLRELLTTRPSGLFAKTNFRIADRPDSIRSSTSETLRYSAALVERIGSLAPSDMAK